MLDLARGRYGWFAFDCIFAAFWLRILVQDTEAEEATRLPGGLTLVFALLVLAFYRSTK
jgi:hypothetical protein